MIYLAWVHLYKSTLRCTDFQRIVLQSTVFCILAGYSEDETCSYYILNTPDINPSDFDIISK